MCTDFLFFLSPYINGMKSRGNRTMKISATMRYVAAIFCENKTVKHGKNGAVQLADGACGCVRAQGGSGMGTLTTNYVM